jgi:hypothetical protein
VWCMVVISQVMVDDGVVGMVSLDQMFQRPWSLLCRCFDIVNLD